jgi:methylenetetrahydrofolate--tRNA-(uracil-5-)-methyltransferase
MKQIVVVGAGLAGSEAAWQALQMGVKTTLYEMRPSMPTKVHQTDLFAELVCSNSLKNSSLSNAAGALKEEMRRIGSLTMETAAETQVPAGQALAVDRTLFSQKITQRLSEHPNLTLRREEFTQIDPDAITIIATGPLTSSALAEHITRIAGAEHLYFYDAVAPTIDASTINREIAFAQSRYDKSDPDYLNCPLSRDEYDAFYDALIHAELAPLHEDEARWFEGCMPIETLASRGPKTLCFGPMKPKGLTDPRTGHRPWAAIQLRQENKEATLYSLVGFQTRMKWPEQTRVLRLVPGLENAEIVRFGVIHRNTYINSPKLLSPTLQMRENPNLFFAGQITGVEGYVESAATGIVAGRNAARVALGLEPLTLPTDTVLGSLLDYVSGYDGKDFQPMNANWGVVPSLDEKIRDKKAKGEALSARALNALAQAKGWEPLHTSAP